jgi:hypothetical protein
MTDPTNIAAGAVTTVCQPGYKCEEGCDTPYECLAGTYQPNEGQWECLPCPNGFYCYSGTDAVTS